MFNTSGARSIILSNAVLLLSHVRSFTTSPVTTKNAAGEILTPAPLPPPNGSFWFWLSFGGVLELNSLPPAANPKVTFEIGIIIILGIVLLPMIKLIVIFISFHLTSAVCEIVGDEKIVKLISQVSDSYKVLIAILLSVSVMFIIGITLVIKITNSTLMYRWKYD